MACVSEANLNLLEEDSSQIHPDLLHDKRAGPQASDIDNPEAGRARGCETYRFLMDAWDLGSDPSSWQWKSDVQRPVDQHNSFRQRPIRSLPVDRALSNNHARSVSHASPLAEESQSAIPVVRPIVATSPAHRHSSPPYRSMLDTEGRTHGIDLTIQTQTESGPHGSRIPKRKSQKRRQGGF